MTSYTEISPNEPDVMPDYVDDKSLSVAKKPGKQTGTRTATQPVNATAHSLKSTANLFDAAPSIDSPSPSPEIAEQAPATERNTDSPKASRETAPVAEPFVHDARTSAKKTESVLVNAPEEMSAGITPDTLRIESAYREGECIPNLPDVSPDFVTETEAAAFSETVRPQESLTREPAEQARSPWMRWYLVGTVLAVAVFGMLVFSQAVSALALARTLPLWAQYILLIPLGFCCVAVLGVCASLVHGWFKLREVRQIDLSALEELRSRAKSRQDGIEHFQEARSQLEGYLKRYPLTHEGQAGLVRAGIAAEKIEELARTRHRLMGLSVDSRSWLDDFSVNFQADLDKAALSRVNGWAIKAAGCVIASPLPLLDSALVLGISMKMMKDLCSLYNVRATRTGCLVLLNKAIIAAFIAGVAEDATEVAGGLAAEELSQMMGESTLNSLGARVAGVVTPKLGEGAINAFFIRRLGKATVRMLQPLKPKTKK